MTKKNALSPLSAPFEMAAVFSYDWLDIKPASTWGEQTRHAMTIQANIERLGFSFSESTLMALSCASVDRLRSFYKDALPLFRSKVGALASYAPLYPNFPQQVVEADEAVLMADALAQYEGDLVGARVLPAYEKKERERAALLQRSKPTLVSFVSSDSLALKLIDVFSSNASLSPSVALAARFVLLEFSRRNLETIGEIARSVRERSSSRENMALFAAAMSASGRLHDAAPLEPVALDALRLAVAVSHGDVSLAEPSRILKLSRPVRRLILSVLEQAAAGDSTQALENMHGRREMFLRLGERLHPGEFGKIFPIAAELFRKLREEKAPESFLSVAERHEKNGEISESVELLASRPGILARRLVALVNKGADSSLVTRFEKAAPSVSTPVLLQAYRRMRDLSLSNSAYSGTRTFLVKGGLGRLFFEEPSAFHLPDSEQTRIFGLLADVCEKTLENRFAALPPLGKVWIDPSVEGVLLPFAQRSAGKTLKILSRGSRVKIDPDASVIRLFVWWSERGVDADGKKTTSDRIDVDLSAFKLDQSFSYSGHCSWTNLRTGKSGKTAELVHSGDVTSAPDGACEFIDINLEKMTDIVAITLNSFTGQTFLEMPEARFGWMVLPKAQAGEVFDPRAVVQQSDLTVNGRAMMPLIFDPSRREIIWVDSAYPSSLYGGMAERQKNQIERMTRGMCAIRRPTIEDLMLLHVSARGELAESREDADFVVAFDGDLSPFDAAEIASNWMSDFSASPSAKKSRKGPR